MKHRIIAAVLSGLLLTACGDSSSEAGMQYIKTSVMFDTITDMYENPDNYLGKQYHMVGTLYPGEDHDSGEHFYSIYTEGASGHGIGIELKYDSFEGFSDYDKVTVEGTLDSEKMKHDGKEVEVLILRVSSLSKRQS